MIIKIENNKIKILKLYSKVRVGDAQSSYNRCEDFLKCLILHEQDKTDTDPSF